MIWFSGYLQPAAPSITFILDAVHDLNTGHYSTNLWSHFSVMEHFGSQSDRWSMLHNILS